MTHVLRTVRVLPIALTLLACDKIALAKGDSLRSALTEQQTLAAQLQSQKDSLTRVVLDVDAFLGQMDSAVRTVRGMPKSKRNTSESPLADQVAQRREVMDRVSALVTRAKSTANQLAELQKRQSESKSQTQQLKDQLAAQSQKTAEDAQMVADLGATIERQRVQIVSLEQRIDSLSGEINALGMKHFRAYYVVGTEKELMDKGLIVKEGGANLLIARPGQTLQPARVLDAAAFTEVDQRETKMIPLPDSTRRYRVVSRQSLDDAEVEGRDGTTFKGSLKIAKPDEFWAPSRFLIIVRM